ncbi:SDR family NAD(P)-dependent oxidoreductase [Microbacterium sp. NPDC077663]|uniref:SDR family NAD(P)-dependent oxidoreductase n=1 Tax=Microbacterium sp. NPDC077663 TaxID=3364189 RepID=UPI0037CA7070
MVNSIDLSGRHAVITGAASGVGVAALHRFLDSGATVSAWDFDRARLDGIVSPEIADRVDTYLVDVSDWESVKAAAEQTHSAHGKIDILVNSAGMSVGKAPVQDYDLGHWDREIAVNLTGVFYGCKAVFPYMLAGGYGRVVNFSSMAAKSGAKNQSGYVAAKGALIALTKSLGFETAGTGVLVNCLCPGVMDTPFYRSWRDGQSPEVIERATSTIPLGRVASAEEAAGTLAWMVSEDMSYTTGYTFDLSGGRAAF